MTKYREILRLKSLGLSQQSIAVYPAKGAEAGVDILHGLVQIQPYGREVAVPGQGKPGSAGRNAALGFIVHSGSCFLFSG